MNLLRHIRCSRLPWLLAIKVDLNGFGVVGGNMVALNWPVVFAKP